MAFSRQDLLPLLASFLLSLSLSSATTFTITNNCSSQLWAAAFPGGGQSLPSGSNWTLTISASTGHRTSGRIWARTNCTVDSSGNTNCLTGDCNGRLQCTGRGSAPATTVYYALYEYGNNDFYHISLLDGFNVPVEITPTGAGNCNSTRCAANVTGSCPKELKTPGGCSSACNVFKTSEYCCTSRGAGCSPTNYSKFFKQMCPYASSYPQDDPTSTFTCGSGGNYTVTFCPST